jgi:hypothetical protein
MAELVDALVSNTNAARRAGSSPALGTSHKQYPRRYGVCGVFVFIGGEWFNSPKRHSEASTFVLKFIELSLCIA